MLVAEHEQYANDLLSSLSANPRDDVSVNFEPAPGKSRNAAHAMTAIICQRLHNTSNRPPAKKGGTDYEWKEGSFNCRNIADRDYLWTNMRRAVADRIHAVAETRPAAYLLACCSPGNPLFDVWVIPEPVVFSILADLPPKDGSSNRAEWAYSIEISPENHRIKGYAASPDLSPYYNRFRFVDREMRVLDKSRAMDAFAKTERKTSKLLTKSAQRLTELGAFDPNGLRDARRRAFCSIVRRQGQPKFRERLLAAYGRRCAITGCKVEAVLDAAHIVPYNGPETNHPTNGLLLRTDLHTLFDLRLLTIDPISRTVLVSPTLNGTSYEQYHGARIRAPRDAECCPSEKALQWHWLRSRLRPDARRSFGVAASGPIE